MGNLHILKLEAAHVKFGTGLVHNQRHIAIQTVLDKF